MTIRCLAGIAGCPHPHNVRQGESLTHIADVCHDSLPRLTQANIKRFPKPDEIHPGDIVCVLPNCTDDLFGAVVVPEGIC